MEQAFQIDGKKVLVLGAARSGVAAARLLVSRGAEVTLNDLKPADELAAAVAGLSESGVQLRLGEGPEALLAETELVVLSPGIPLEAPFIRTCLDQGLPVIGELELAASLTELPIIAVTGTNGKTTTVSLLGEMFKQAGQVAHVAGNIGFPLSAAVLQAGPEDVLVAEVSSFQLETIKSFNPRAATVLNITPDHLNRHGTMDRYIALKTRVFENQTAADLAVLNLDDPVTRSMADGLKAQVAYVSTQQEVEQGAMLKEGNLVLRLGGEERTICAASSLKLPGIHNVYNALSALALASFMGVPPQVAAYSLKVFEGVEHRIEFVRELDGVKYYNDSKGTNPDATITAIRSMRSPTVLIMGGHDKQTPFNQLAKSAKSSPYIREVVLVGQTADQIADALKQTSFQACRTVATLKDAVAVARELAQPGGNVLFSPACASFDQFKDYEERGRVFKQLVMAFDAPGE